MDKKINKRYLWLAVSVMILSSLACNTLQVGVVTPTTGGGIQPASGDLETSQPLETGEPEEGDQTQPEQGSLALDAVAWFGHIASMPEGSLYDDILILHPEGSGEFGLAGATPDIEAEIRTLRDGEGPQHYVHLWGSFSCGVEDVNDCQLVVERLQYGAKLSEEAVSDWVGTIQGFNFNMGPVFGFVLDGEIPAHYGIYASQDPSLKAEIESLSDTGTLVKVSGTLLVGFPDVNSSRIEVSSLQVIEQSQGQLTDTSSGESLRPTDAPLSEASGRISFDELGISLEIPEGLVVIKDPSVNLDDPSKLDSYMFYIQNYGPADGPGEDYFQMYGLLQYLIPPVAWEGYASDVLSSDMYSYAEQIEVNGLQGLDTQFGGERNRFVYYFSLDGRVLSIYVSHPTEENKALADQIISSLEFTSGALTDASGVQKVTDPQGFYSLYLPTDWEIEFSEPDGIRLAGLLASSPGAEVVVEENDGPHANVYQKQGVFLSIAVLDDESALSSPLMAQIDSQTPIMIEGIPGEDYVFTEPSTMEGEIREIRYYYNGLSYLVRFSYAENADKLEIDWMTRNFRITQ